MTVKLILTAANLDWRAEIVPGTVAVLGRCSRDPGDVPLAHPSLFRHHARVFERDGQWLIEDLHFHPPFKVNGTEIDISHPINAGDRIQLGPYVVIDVETTAVPPHTPSES